MSIIKLERKINERSEGIIVAFRKTVGNFNDLTGKDSTRHALVCYVARKTGVPKEYVKSYVHEVWQNMDDPSLDDDFDVAEAEGEDIQDEE